MTSGRSDLIDIACDVKMTKGLGTAVSQGDKDKDGKEIWIWLPTSQIEVNDDGTITMPEWLAEDKGLI